MMAREERDRWETEDFTESLLETGVREETGQRVTQAESGGSGALMERSLRMERTALRVAWGSGSWPAWYQEDP